MTETKIPAPSGIADIKDVPARIYLISQAERPDEIRRLLVDSAVSDGWFNVLVNLNTAIFVGLIALTADFGTIESLAFLAIQFTLSTVGIVVLLVLQVRRQKSNPVNNRTTESLLTLTDILFMAGWGLGVLLFAAPLIHDRSLMIIVLLTAAGISSAVLNARLLYALILGRLILFLPALAFVFYHQPPFWGLLGCTLLFAAAVSIGIGYAVHVQHLNQENIGLRLRQTTALLERTFLQERLVQERLLGETKLRERFLHSITHDLNQPLGALSLYINDLASRRLPARAAQAAAAARQCLTSARALIQSVSQLAWIRGSIPPARMETVELQPLLQRIVEDSRLVAAERDVEIDMVQTSVHVRADRDFLERALRNLVHNAIQYARGGRIVAGVRRRSAGKCEIIVADNGLGISQEHQKRIFETFYQIDAHTSRRVGNIGLGLSIVNDLVTAMGGTVTLQSAVDRGSLFGVVLPLAAKEDSLTAETFSKTAFPGKQRHNGLGTVLLVEDQAHFLQAITAMLEDLGYDTDAAGSPAEFDKIDNETLARYDYLVMDFDLGNGLDAFDILNRGQVHLLSSCLIVSRHDSPELLLHIESGGGQFLKKPFEIDALARAMNELQRNRKARLPAA